MSTSSEFLSVVNFKKCCEVFSKYMEDQYGVSVVVNNDNQLKQTMFNIMRSTIHKAEPTTNVIKLNNMVLNEMRDVCLAKFNVSAGSNRKPRVRPLERDRDVYGARELNLGEHIKPEMNPPRRDDSSFKSVDDIRNERESAIATNHATNPVLPFQVIKVTNAPTTTELDMRLEEIAKMRELADTSQTTTTSLTPNNSRMDTTLEISKLQKEMVNDPKQLYSLTIQDRKDDIEEARARAAPYTNFSQQSLIAPAAQLFDKKTYVIFNGYDRQWELHPFRYGFTLDINDVTRSIKNIVEIAFTRLIIPMEILQLKNTTLVQTGETPYYNQYGLTYPYLMLQVDELTPGMYEGFNKTTQKCFTSFVYHREYRASNGRGFIIMQPLQEEKKEYIGAPLSTMPRLTIRVVKPNGTLYNMARDENRVDFLIYESVNPLLARVMCVDFFDSNEFAIGDVVRIQDFKLMTPTEFANAVLAVGNGPASPSDIATYGAGITSLEEFMNRDEGHEIIMTGDPNQSSFINNFSVYLPRKLDRTQGTLVLQKDIFDTITVCQNYLSKVPHMRTARLMNMTLQVVMTMKVKTQNADVTQVIKAINI